MDRSLDSDSEIDADEDFSPENKVDEKAIKLKSHSTFNKEASTGSPRAKDSNVTKKNLWYNHVRNVLIFLAVFVAIIYQVLCGDKGSGNEVKQNELRKYLDFLKSEYDHQDPKLWNVIESQVAEYLMDNKAPLTIVMVYAEAEKTARLLANEVSKKAVELKHSDDLCGDLDSLKIEGTVSNFEAGYLLSEKLTNVSRCKKLLIFNVENLRPSAATDLHSMLDPDYPNVESAVYVFTVKITADSEGSIYHIVSNLLQEQWGTELHADVLEPLLSRIVNFVKVEREPIIDV